MFVHGIRPGSSEEEEEEDVMDILMVNALMSGPIPNKIICCLYKIQCVTEKKRRMRAESEKRGDGPPAGVHIPASNRWHWFASTRNNGPRFRGKHGKI